MKRSAFTLIELLLVIAIISLLAAILVPVFARAREKARQTSCSSNLKQIGLGLMQYVQDFDETYPFTFYGYTLGVGNTYVPGAGYHWTGAIQPYIKSTAVFSCPSNTKNGGFPNSPVTATTPISYGANGYSLFSFGNARALLGDGTIPQNPAQPQYPLIDSKILSSSQMIAVTETIEPNYSFFDVAAYSILGTPDPIDCGVANSWNRWGGCLFAGHSGRTNYLFADGHVKALLPLQTIDATVGGSSLVNMWTYDQSTFTGPNILGAREALTNCWGY